MKNVRLVQGPTRFGAKVCFCEAPGRKSASLRGFLLERMGHLAQMNDSTKVPPSDGPIV